MTIVELEKLRNENRDDIIDAFHKAAQLFEWLAETIKAGGTLADDAFDNVIDIDSVTVPFKGEYITLIDLFSEAIEEKTE